MNDDIIRIGLYTALQKFGPIGELAKEFSELVFPLWLTHFRGNGYEKNIEPNSKLVDTTECFCYLDGDVHNEDDACLENLTQDQLAYLDVFASVFRYDTSFALQIADHCTSKEAYCINVKCSNYTEFKESLCLGCRHFVS